MNEKLARYSLFFAPDPGANASIGGMLANNAAGSCTVKYGATKDNVLAMEVELPYKDEETRQRAVLANDAIVTKAIQLDGTCTGEHGVGIGKVVFIRHIVGYRVSPISV